MDTPIERLEVSAFEIPTEGPESDGTLEWDSTTLVLVEASGGGRRSLGYTYCDAAAARLVDGRLRQVVEGRSALDPPGAWIAMLRELRNTGVPGLGSCAVAAVDVALWDLKARLLELPLCTLLGAQRGEVEAYGSGGFTSYSVKQLQQQLSGWVQDGLRRVKMKVGREPDQDPARVLAARQAIGDAELMVDANGAYQRKQALALAERFAGEAGVRYFEEPVSSDDREGLRLLRDRGPSGVAIAAGEYGYRLEDFRLLLEAGAVDILQADATRCGGVTGFMKVDALCMAFGLPLSAHTAPHLHAHLMCACTQAVHVEAFHDHLRIERMLFDGALEVRKGCLAPDRGCPGLGLSLRGAEAERYRVAGRAPAHRGGEGC